MKELGIIVFAHVRPLILADTLESLKKQGVINLVDLWIDGDQGIPHLKEKTAMTKQVGNNFNLNSRRYHRGQLGFRKLILLAMRHAASNYDKIIFLEDDCFPTKNAVEIFSNELDDIKSDSGIFSVYGHPFLMAEENNICTRFQGWGWATTSEKLTPFIDKLVNCYSMYEDQYLKFVKKAMTPDILARIEVTPPRLPSHTLNNFYAWDETLCLLTALEKKVHKLASKRIIYNCGMGEGSSRFKGRSLFFEPPYNMIESKDIWKYF